MYSFLSSRYFAFILSQAIAAYLRYPQLTATCVWNWGKQLSVCWSLSDSRTYMSLLPPLRSFCYAWVLFRNVTKWKPQGQLTNKKLEIVDFFACILLVSEPPGSVVSCCHSFWKISSHYHFIYFFHSLFSFFSFSYCNYAYIIAFVVFSQFLEILFLNFFFFSFSVGTVCWLNFKLPDSFLDTLPIYLALALLRC